MGSEMALHNARHAITCIREARVLLLVRVMRIVLALVLVGCVGAPEDPVLRIEPGTIDLDVELGVPKRLPVIVTADGTPVTAMLALEGMPLGATDATSFIASGSTAGRAELVATFDGVTARAPVHVILHSRRYVDAAPVDAPEWFRAATETIVDAALEPGDNSVLPPNLGRLDVHFSADDWEDIHEVAITAPDLDLRVYAFGAPGARRVQLTPTEWYAIASSNLGGTVQLAVRSTRIIARDNVRTAVANLRIAELPIANELLFTGRMGTELPQMWSYELGQSQTTKWMPALPAGSCVGCHVARSKDARYIAAGGNDGVTGGGLILDTTTREIIARPAAAMWIAAAYDPGGTLVSATQGILTHRDGATATPIRTIQIEALAGQPAISHDGRMLAFTSGPWNETNKNPDPLEIRIHPWNAGAGLLGPSRLLVERVAGETVKLPEFSPDAEWLLYTRVRANGEPELHVRPTDGRFIPIELVEHADFGRFASPLTAARAGSAVPEPMAWIIMKREVPVGVRNQDKVGQLWAAAFFPERGVASRPFHLPGQRPDVTVLHAPLALP